MNIGIIGSGLMGSALGTVWAKRGHRITFSYSRDSTKLQALASQVGNGARAGTPSEAAEADVILIAVPWHRLEDALDQAGALNSKVVISCMVPMTEDDSELALGFDTSGAETLAARTGANVIGTFNSVWSDAILAKRDPAETPPSQFYVGDDTTAKATAETLIRDAGFDPVDGGGLENARLLEPFGLFIGRIGFSIDPLITYRFLRP